MHSQFSSTGNTSWVSLGTCGPTLNRTNRGDKNNEHGNEDDDSRAVDDRDILGEAQLAQKPSTLLSFVSFNIIHFITVPKVPRNVSLLAYHLGISSLPALIARFQENPELDVPLNNIPSSQCPRTLERR